MLAALAALAIPAGVSARADATPSTITGTWTRTVTQADVKRRGLAATGPWRLELKSAGTMRLFNNSTKKAIGTGKVTAGPGTLKMVNLLVIGGGRCAKEEETTYRYSLTGGKLVLSVNGRDKCPGRATVLVGTWRRT